jgi:hypothetical protein
MNLDLGFVIICCWIDFLKRDDKAYCTVAPIVGVAFGMGVWVRIGFKAAARIGTIQYYHLSTSREREIHNHK